MIKTKAKSGLDYIRGENWQPAEKSISGWQRYADRKAREMSTRDGITWHGSLFHAAGYVRVNYFYVYK